jgi:hypothetical protein
MNSNCIITLVALLVSICALAQKPEKINLNGQWQFEQTATAFPPTIYSRTIKVPGLIHLAEPRIEEYEKFFKRPEKTFLKEQHNLMDIDYSPKYSWYKKEVYIPLECKNNEAILSIRKSQYFTQIYVNGMDVGGSMECYTPIEFSVSTFLKYGSKNEILIRVGERIWLPSEAAGSTDKEKEHYLPGIWDDVSLNFTGKLHIHRVLILPDAKNSSVTAKILVRSLYPAQLLFGSTYYDSCKIQIDILRKDNNKKVGSATINGNAKRDNQTYFETNVSISEPQLWSTDKPFLYVAKVCIFENDVLSDIFADNFGLRDFEITGKHFYLNGEQTYLRGTNITLQRFFEDPECGDLAWNRKWVTKLLSDIPKQTHWNGMRICVGIVPDFWYDIADSCGLLLQNEWFYWQHHGWDEEIRKEYTNWVWSDGNHPSIVIWDGINENKNDYIGNQLIPELKKLDPTRIWDAGFMEGKDMISDEMDEPHPYMCGWDLMNAVDPDKYIKENPYSLGKIDNWSQGGGEIPFAKSAQLVNEYGWIWLWRDGSPAKLTKTHYDYFVGKNATPAQRFELQAYWLQLETEWLRAERSIAGVLAFCLLTNNYGYTGDYFMGNIKDLKPTPTLDWFPNCFAPTAVFIDLADQRYFRYTTPYKPGSDLVFNLVGVNDLNTNQSGKVIIKLLDNSGNIVITKSLYVEISAFQKNYFPVNLTLPNKMGGYLLIAELTLPSNKEKIISRRYLRVGDGSNYTYYDYKP